ncbi:MAG: acyltransferase [Lachnospiraceae bacterium]|nr:acyltransferase [Lachnospiraceae bacterium]
MKVKYDLLGKYRAEIMGLAILLIMFCHNTMVFPGFVNNINSGLRALCDSGVNIFFFFSGYGCYYSMKKNANVLSFYKRRAGRIIPAFLIVLFVYGIFNVFAWHIPVRDYLWSNSLISFYTDGLLYEWFIAAILVLYLVFPFFFWLAEKHEKILVGLIVIIYLFTFAWMFRLFKIPQKNLATVCGIFVNRIPNALIGTLIARKTTEDGKIGKGPLWLLSILGLISCGVSLYAFKFSIRNYWLIMRTIYFFVATMIIIFWVWLRVKTEGNRVVNAASRGLFFIGGITLEIYLLHEKVLAVISFLLQVNNVRIQSIVSVIVNIVAVAVSILAAHFLKMLTDKVFRIKKRN